MRNKKIHKKILTVFLLVCQLLLSVIPESVCLASQAVPAEEQDTRTGEQDILVQELDLGDYETEMEVGAKQLLSVTVLPMDAANQNITYSSSRQEVATINGMGRITAVSVGTTEITVSCGGVTGSFILNVKEEEMEKTVQVTDIELADYEEELEVGKTLNLSATVLPAEASETTVSFRSEHPQTASVSSTGEIKGIAPGQATITMQAGNFSKSIVITVKIVTAAIVLDNAYVVMKSGETCQLKGQVQPSGASQKLNFKSMDESIVSVSGDGFITAKAAGSTTIIVSNADMSTAATVIVNETEEASGETPEEMEMVEETDLTEEESDLLKKLESVEKGETLEISVENCEKITPAVLKVLYTAEKNLLIKGKNYTIELFGEDIINYENTLYTELKEKKTAEGMEFVLNQGENLPGQVKVSFPEEESYRYMYLYNTSAEKYEKIAQEDMSGLKLNTAGKYLLTVRQIKGSSIKMFAVMGVIVIILGLGAAYIVIKKRYWFW